LRERLRALMGDMKLLAVDFSAPFAIESTEPDATFEQSSIAHAPSCLRVWGLIGTPGVSRSTREDQHLFVNRRPVENRGLNFALMEGYHTALMKGRYPVCCLFLEIDPAAVDVNIHPAKREVKFHREAEVRRLTAQAVREALLAFHSMPEKSKPDFNAKTQRPPSRQVEHTEAIGQPFEIKPTPEFSTPSLPEFPLPLKPTPEWPSRPAEQPPLRMGFSQATGSDFTHPPSPDYGAASHAPRTTPAAPSSTLHPPSSPLLSVPLRLVGVIGKLYVVLESDRGLVLLDQHAAHERILFEQMLERLERSEHAPSQKLLLPETVELPARDAQFLREQLPALTRLGVGLSEFGERTFLLDALPPFVKVSDSRRFVLDLVDELKAVGKDVNSARLGEHTVAKTVCRHAVKANDPLRGRELENLVEDLRRCAMPYTCPHGRPTLIEMNYRELEKKFGRTQ
jgi:DNA mismatch repair protein MutL